jgi:hypothetical protein
VVALVVVAAAAKCVKLANTSRKMSLLIGMIIISIVSFIITWFLALYLQLSWWQLFGAFVGLLLLNNVLINRLYPLHVLAGIIRELSGIQLFGIALYGLSSSFINIFVLYKRFGLRDGMLLGVGASVVAQTLFGLISQI